MIIAPNSIEAKKHFHVAGLSGALAASAAGEHVFAFRNPSTRKAICITRIRVHARTTTGFTAAQEHGYGLYKLTSYDANHSGGTALGSFISSRDLPAFTSELTGANVMIATTGSLTQNSAPVTATHPFDWDSYGDLAAAATVQKGRIDIDWGSPDFKGLPLGTDEGFAVAPLVTLGAGGAVRLGVEVCWYEL